MSESEIVGTVVLLALCCAVAWAAVRAGSKPRLSPKVPRDRSKDARWVFFIGL